MTTTAAEIMITYDPTPATWLWGWDSDIRENANFAASMGFIYKRHHTTADAGLFISDTNEVYAFPGGTPSRDLGSDAAEPDDEHGLAVQSRHALRTTPIPRPCALIHAMNECRQLARQSKKHGDRMFCNGRRRHLLHVGQDQIVTE